MAYKAVEYRISEARGIEFNDAMCTMSGGMDCWDIL